MCVKRQVSTIETKNASPRSPFWFVGRWVAGPVGGGERGGGGSWEKRSAHPPPARVITRAFKCLWPRESTRGRRPFFFLFLLFLLSRSFLDPSLLPSPLLFLFPFVYYYERTTKPLLRSLCSLGISIPFETRLRFRLVGEWKWIIGRRRPR